MKSRTSVLFTMILVMIVSLFLVNEKIPKYILIALCIYYFSMELYLKIKE